MYRKKTKLRQDKTKAALAEVNVPRDDLFQLGAPSCNNNNNNKNCPTAPVPLQQGSISRYNCTNCFGTLDGNRNVYLIFKVLFT